MLELVTVRARTRGKGPQEFLYQGIGKLTPRNVSDKDNNDIVLDADGKAVEYSFDKEGKIVTKSGITQDEKGNLVLPEGYRYVTVDEVNASGITEDLQEVLDLFGTIKSDVSPLQRVIDGSLNYFNILSRKEASPVSEVVTEDELTPIIDKLKAANILSADDVATWRRTVTSASKVMEIERGEFVKMTKEYKAAVKVGVKFEEAA